MGASNVRISKADSSLMDAPRTGGRKALSPRKKAQQQYERLINKLNSPDDVFRVSLGKDEKAVTIRQRLLRVAADEGKEIAVRKHENGYLVALMTPDRRTNRRHWRKAAGS
jgi:hypothetical protein